MLGAASLLWEGPWTVLGGSVLSSLHAAGEKLLTLLNSASSGGFKVVEFPYALLFLFSKGRDALDRAERKQRNLKTKSCDNSIQKCGVKGSVFPCIAQLPDSSSSFWRAPGGWKFAAFCVSTAHGTLPSPLWPLPYTLSLREGRSWKLACPGTFPIHKNLLLPPRQRRSKKGRESPELSKFKFLFPSSMAAVLSSEGIRLIAVCTASSCLLGAATEILNAQRKTLPSCPGSEASIICVVLQRAVPGDPGLMLPKAVQRIGVCSCPKEFGFLTKKTSEVVFYGEVRLKVAEKSSDLLAITCWGQFLRGCLNLEGANKTTAHGEARGISLG